jgi:hypothetical protein
MGSTAAVIGSVVAASSGVWSIAVVVASVVGVGSFVPVVRWGRERQQFRARAKQVACLYLPFQHERRRTLAGRSQVCDPPSQCGEGDLDRHDEPDAVTEVGPLIDQPVEPLPPQLTDNDSRPTFPGWSCNDFARSRVLVG